MTKAQNIQTGSKLSGLTVTSVERTDSGMVRIGFANGHSFLYEAWQLLEVEA
jgi:hypothetical protein